MSNLVEDDDNFAVRCIGVDGKQHAYLPWKDTTICGQKIANKKPESQDWERFSCYECTY